MFFQKCICTIIKPSRLVYHDLNDLISYSEFVANYITYIKLEDPTTVVKYSLHLYIHCVNASKYYLTIDVKNEDLNFFYSSWPSYTIKLIKGTHSR